MAKKNSGQIMLLSVVILSGVFLGAAALAGFMTLYQIRQTKGIADSVKAIYAADAGIEWRLDKYFHSERSYDKPKFSDDKTDFDTSIVEDSASGLITIKSTASSSQSYRAFEMSLEEQQ